MVVSPFFLFLSPLCNSLEVKASEEAALNKLNADWQEGCILGLQRIFDAQVRSHSLLLFFFPSIW